MGQITELPSYPQMYHFFPKEMLQVCFFAALRIMFQKGALDPNVKGSLVEQFPEIKPRKVRELVQQACGGRA